MEVKNTISQKERERIEKKVRKRMEKHLQSGVLSILRYTTKKSSPYLPNILNTTNLLGIALLLEENGLLKIPKNHRGILLEKSIAVLNYAEERAKIRKPYSVKDLLKSSLRVEKKIMKEKEIKPK